MPEPTCRPLPVPFPEDEAAQGALEVCRKLATAGHLAWLAGGCVRDLLRGEAVRDYDIASEATTAEVQTLFRRTVPVGEAFGVVRVLGQGKTPPIWEVARFRTESGYSDGRHPDEVRPGTPAEDAGRRDFTINGLFLDPATMTVIDHVGGLQDLQAGVLRAIGDPERRFGEDYLRMLRAARFAGRTGFAIDPPTAVAIQRLASRITAISAERITEELRRLLAAASAVAGLSALIDLGLAAALFPQAPGGAGAAGDLRVRVLGPAAAATEACPGEWLPPLAALLDCGAPPAPEPDLLEQAGSVLRLSRPEAAGLRGLECRRGLMAGPAAGPAGTAASKRLCRRPGFPAALALLAGDPRPENAALAEEWRELRQGWTARDLAPPRLLSPGQLMAAGIPRGPEVGQALRALEDAQLAGEVETEAAARAWLAQRSTGRP